MQTELIRKITNEKKDKALFINASVTISSATLLQNLRNIHIFCLFYSVSFSGKNEFLA